MRKFVTVVFIALSSLLSFAHDISSFQNMSKSEREYALQNWIVMPEKYKSCNESPKSFIIEKSVSVDSQKHFECAGCSIAFLLRFYGQEADGIKLYNSKTFPCKHSTGAYPKVFEDYFKYKNYSVNYYTGTIEDLKNAVSKGTPVIVMLIYPKNSLHYVPVVGYDSENIYIQDSVPKYRNCFNKFYNEKISIYNFEKMWNIPIDYCSNLFVEIIKN